MIYHVTMLICFLLNLFLCLALGSCFGYIWCEQLQPSYFLYVAKLISLCQMNVCNGLTCLTYLCVCVGSPSCYLNLLGCDLINLHSYGWSCSWNSDLVLVLLAPFDASSMPSYTNIFASHLGTLDVQRVDMKHVTTKPNHKTMNGGCI